MTVLTETPDLISIPALNVSRQPRHFATMALDVPALGLEAGQPVTLRETDEVDCDGLFVLAPVEDLLQGQVALARLQHWTEPGTLRRTDMDGTVSIVQRSGVDVVACLNRQI